MPDAITLDNINEVANKLDNPDVIKQVEILVELSVTGGAIGSAKRLLLRLESVVRGAKLVGRTKSIYESFLLRLKFTAFSALDEAVQKELLSNHILYAFENDDIDVKDKIMRVFAPYLKGDEDVNKLEKFIKSLDSNTELIGTRDIVVADKSVKPTIGNWLRDYQIYLGQRDGDTFNSVNYITKSKNVSSLNIQEKELLKKTLQFYNWLRYDFMHLLRGEWLKVVPLSSLSVGIGEQNKIRQTVEGSKTYDPAEMLPYSFSRELVQDVEEFSKTVGSNYQHKSSAIPVNRTTSKMSERREVSGYKLTDVLEKARLRSEAGLQVDTEQAKLIVELIKQKKSQSKRG